MARQATDLIRKKAVKVITNTFGANASECDHLKELLCQSLGFPSRCGVSMHTYTRKVDPIIANAVEGLRLLPRRLPKTTDISTS